MRFLLGMIAALVLLCAATAQDLSRERVERLLDRAGCQRELPGALPAEAGDDREVAADARESTASRDWRLPGIGNGLAEVAFWTFVVVVVAFLVVLIARAVPGIKPAAKNAARRRLTAAAAQREAPAPPPRPVPAHAALADAGDFAAAVHALLQRAFAVWEQRTAPLPLQATGREVLRVVRRGDVPSEAFSALVVAGERVHFGGRPADRQLYEASLRQLATWEDACRSR